MRQHLSRFVEGAHGQHLVKPAGDPVVEPVGADLHDEGD